MDMDEKHMDMHQNSIQVGNMGQDFNIVNINPDYFQNICHNVFSYLTQLQLLHHNTKFPFPIPFFLTLFFQ